jgi:DNA repair protein RadC
MDAHEYVGYLGDMPEEHFVVLHLTTRHEVLALHEISHGTLSASLVHPREVFKGALLANAHAILVAHNHPGGSVTPSREDLKTTEQLLAAGKILGIGVIDHLIVAGDQCVSIRESHPHLWGD